MAHGHQDLGHRWHRVSVRAVLTALYGDEGFAEVEIMKTLRLTDGCSTWLVHLGRQAGHLE